MAEPSAAWRDSARTPRFFFVDAYATFPMVILFVHIKLWTFILALVSIVFFAILEKFKFSIPIFKRWLRSTLAGNVRVARPNWRE